MPNTDGLAEKTIADFGDQWTEFTDNSGYYGSIELLQDLFQPLLNIGEIKDKRIADIGSGTGRIAKMILDAGAAHVTAIEPSAAFEVLKKNLHAYIPRKVECLRTTGENVPVGKNYGMVFCCGVLHHIPAPQPVANAAYAALKPGGKFCVWVYAKEGNELYLSIFNPIRYVTRFMPHWLLAYFVRILDIAVVLYGKACTVLPLPLSRYFNKQLNRFSPDKRRLVIYDQLNPAYAKYYKKHEVESLLRESGFTNIQIHHRHGYSWSAIGIKPVAINKDINLKKQNES